ncbi:hypothetical protein AZ048_000685, partial [Escherichia coli]
KSPQTAGSIRYWPAGTRRRW